MFDPRSKYYLPAMLVIISLVGALVAWGTIWVINRGSDDGRSVAAVAATKPKDIGSGVAAFGDAVPVDMKAQPIQSDYPVNKEQVVSLSDMVRITPEGKLPGKVTLVFTLAKRVDIRNGAVFVATREAGKAWTFVQPKLSADGATASVEVDHLSDWWMFFLDVTKYLGVALKDYLADLFLKPFAKAKAPPCPKDKAQRATADNYTVKRTGDAILSCFARENDKSKRTMTITGNRPYPMQAKHPGFDVVDAGQWKVEFSNLARVFSGGESILYPHGTITYSVELEMNHFAKVSAEYSGATANYVRMDIALQTLLYIVGRLNIKFVTSFDDNVAVIDRLLGYTDCFNAFGSASIGTLLLKCFTVTALTAIFGSGVGIVMGGLAVVTGLVSWISSEFSSVSDMIQSRDRSMVTVARLRTLDMVAGRWGGHVTRLVIRKDGTGTYGHGLGPCGSGMCEMESTVQVVPTDNGAKVTIQSVRYLYGDGAGQRALSTTELKELVPYYDRIQKGASFVVVREARGLLKSTQFRGMSTVPYFCGNGVSVSNQVKCGA